MGTTPPVPPKAKKKETLRAKWIAAADYRRGRISAIVLHSTDGRKAGDIPTLTAKGSPTVSCHFYVTRKGELYQFVREDDTAYHAGIVLKQEDGNASTIGIECEHFDPNDDYPRGEDWPDIQIRTIAKLIAYLRNKYGTLPVKSHAEIAAPIGRKIDPHDFPWTILGIYVKGEMNKEWTLERY